MKKKKKDLVKPATIDIIVDGIIKESIPLDMANADPIRASRYEKLAENGDQEAQKKLDEMKKTKMYYIEEDQD